MPSKRERPGGKGRCSTRTEHAGLPKDGRGSRGRGNIFAASQEAGIANQTPTDLFGKKLPADGQQHVKDGTRSNSGIQRATWTGRTTWPGICGPPPATRGGAGKKPAADKHISREDSARTSAEATDKDGQLKKDPRQKRAVGILTTPLRVLGRVLYPIYREYDQAIADPGDTAIKGGSLIRATYERHVAALSLYSRTVMLGERPAFEIRRALVSHLVIASSQLSPETRGPTRAQGPWPWGRS